ncbi:hypothetical protein [Chryseobacterium sp. M5A1_1a]
MTNKTSKSMIKKAISLFLIIISGALSAQKNHDIKFAICNNIVGTVKIFDNYKDQIEKVNTFKTKAGLPTNLKKFDYLADNGLTEIKLKKNANHPDNMSLEMLNEQYGLPKNTPVYIEGYKLDNPETHIYSEIITNGEIKDSDGQKALHISTTSD